jgi:predicted enzyme related to lactoylglutathione lyase
MATKRIIEKLRNCLRLAMVLASLACVLIVSCHASNHHQGQALMSSKNDTINYIEFALTDGDGTKAFYSSVFAWQFQDWGPDYLSFSNADVDGGFSRERTSSAAGTGPLIVLHADDLEAKVASVRSAGMEIFREIFEFPGGRRFHFIDPNGNEIAVWSESADK